MIAAARGRAASRLAALRWRSASAAWLLGSLGLALLVIGSQSVAAGDPTPELVAAPAATALAAAPARRQCEECGVVTELRRVEADGKAPASYIFFVRMSDGSRRESSAPELGRWQVGDRIILIGAPLRG